MKQYNITSGQAGRSSISTLIALGLGLALGATATTASAELVGLNAAGTASSNWQSSQDYSQLSTQDLRTRSANGDKRATFQLAHRALRGMGQAADPAEAFRLYKTLADEGYNEARLNVGRLYAQGKGTAQDLAQARRYLAEPARNGDSRAVFILADIESQNPTRLADAYALYRTAADDEKLANGVRSVAQQKATRLALALSDRERSAAETRTRQWLGNR